MTIFNSNTSSSNVNASYEVAALATRELFNNPAMGTPKDWSEEQRLLAIGIICERRFTVPHRVANTLEQEAPDCTVSADEIVAWAVDAKLIKKGAETRVDGIKTIKYVRTDRLASMLALCEVRIESRIQTKVRGSTLTEKTINKMNSMGVKANPTVRAWASQAWEDKELRESLNKDKKEMIRVITNMSPKPFTQMFKLDHRGRLYAYGTMIRHDGDTLMRSAFERAEATRPVNLPQALEAVCLQIADELKCKESMSKRIRVGGKYAANTTPDYKAWVKNPTLARLVLGFKELMETGETALMVYQDATSSGIQHSAVITGDKQLAEKVNLTPADRNTPIRDVYKAVADAMDEGRRTAKDCMMPRIYGAGEDSTADAFYKMLTVDMGMDEYKAEERTREVMVKFFEAESREIPMVRALAKALQSYGAVDGEMVWTMPDGFRVVQAEKDYDACSVRIGRFHTYTKNKAQISASLQASAFPPNLVHSIDAYHLRKVICAAGYDVMSIHDSVGCAPEHYFELSELIRKKFYETHMEVDAEKLVREATGREDVALPFTGDYDLKDCLQAINMFC